VFTENNITQWKTRLQNKLVFWLTIMDAKLGQMLIQTSNT